MGRAFRDADRSVNEALDAVLERIAAACDRAGRPTGDVQLVAVSKTMPAARVNAVIDAGQRILGENKVQEALDKRDAVRPEARWHFIGHLQRNKARHVAGKFELIHSVDNEKLAAELDKRSAAAEVVQPVLLQLNLSGEATKSGVDEGGLAALIDVVADLGALDLQGLMTIPPPVATPEDNRPFFARLAELRDGAANRAGRPLPELSMGMTDDFEVAIEEGATLVRVGRAIFGDRPKIG